jgi:hypothetical protein
VRKIAEEFGVSPSTVQAISCPLETTAAAARRDAGGQAVTGEEIADQPGAADALKSTMRP